jgi:hypothetical protein
MASKDAKLKKCPGKIALPKPSVNSLQNLLKAGQITAKLTSRSPTKKPPTQSSQNKGANKPKSLLTKNPPSKGKNQPNSGYDINNYGHQNQYVDSNSVVFDENINPNQEGTGINAHRFSMVQKPSKFIQANYEQAPEAGKKQRPRHQSMNNNSFRSFNEGIRQMTAPTEEQLSQIYCRTEEEDEYQNQSMRNSSRGKVAQAGKNQRGWNEEYTGNGWGLQNQYKLQQMVLETDDADVEILSPRKESRVTPTNSRQEDSYLLGNNKNSYKSQPQLHYPNTRSMLNNSAMMVEETSSSTSMINEDSKKYPQSKSSGNIKTNEPLSAKANSGKNSQVKLKINTITDSSAYTKSSQSTCSGLSARPTVQVPNVVVKMFDPKTEGTYLSGDCTSFECEENVSIINNNNTTKLISTPSKDLNIINIHNTHLACEEDITKITNHFNKPQIQNNNDMEIETVAPLTIEDELRQWEQSINPNDLYVDIFENMIANEEDYTPDPYYFKLKQKDLNWMMRAILIDWMMEVSSEFCLKRETFHIALNYVDRYLSIVPNVPKWDLQLVGLTSMFIASKMEEVYPNKVKDFAKSADDGYNPQQILDMEMKMNQALKWKLVPTTVFAWANWYMVEWDNFVDSSPVVNELRMINQGNNGQELIHFKLANKESYTRYREFMQLIDCGVLNIETLQYKSRPLVASFLYLIIGKYYKQFTLSEIIHDIPQSSYFLFNDSQGLNHMFREFLKFSFGYQLEELLPSIQYAATFFSLPISYELPHAAKLDPDNVLKGHYEEFLSYQTHCQSNLKYVKNIQRK